LIYPNISIIIVNWNNAKDTIKCLESVYQLNYPNYNVILIDNNSKDGSLEKIKKYSFNNLKIKSNSFDNRNSKDNFIKILEYNEEEVNYKLKNEIIKEDINHDKKLIIIKNKKNHGYTEGNNIGIRFAIKQIIPDYLLLLNNDTVVDKDLLKYMVLISEEDEKIAIIQPKLLLYNDPILINSTGNKMDIFGTTRPRGVYEQDHGQYDQFRYEGFFYASGACILISKSLIFEFNENELFDPILFAYHEDVDLSFTARILGFKIAYCPDAICYHKVGASPKNYYTKYYWEKRNNYRVLLKNYSLRYLIFILPSTIFLDFLSTIFSTLYKLKIVYIKIFINSLSWNIKNISDTLKKRQFIQSKRKINDKELMKYMEKTSLKFYSDIYYILNKYYK
jgi:GT2 family glycosyltransferase